MGWWWWWWGGGSSGQTARGYNAPGTLAALVNPIVAPRPGNLVLFLSKPGTLVPFWRLQVIWFYQVIWSTLWPKVAQVIWSPRFWGTR